MADEESKIPQFPVETDNYKGKYDSSAQVETQKKEGIFPVEDKGEMIALPKCARCGKELRGEIHSDGLMDIALKLYCSETCYGEDKREEGVTNDKLLGLPRLKGVSLNPTKLEVERRREELILLINEIGFFKARKLSKQLAEKYEVHFTRIYNDFDWIKGNMKPTDLKEVRIDLKIGRDKAFSEALEILNNAKDDEMKIKAINSVLAAGKIIREELEAWGDKDKVSEKVEVNLDIKERLENYKDLSPEEKLKFAKFVLENK